MELYEAETQEEQNIIMEDFLYIDDCRTILEQNDSPFRHASHMQECIDDSSTLVYGKEQLQAIIPGMTEFGIYQNIAWGYDPEKDIHYFFYFQI